jgi:SAM-dependent methyltransferase
METPRERPEGRLRRLLLDSGVFLYSLDRTITRMLRRRAEVRMDRKLDGTGRVTQTRQTFDVTTDEPGVRFVSYPGNIAHSIWRSQELSLLFSHREELRPPRLDFGCGDGSFASLLFDSVDIGVDNDPEAQRVARQYGSHRHLICGDGSALPLQPESIRSIFSNSVLEHVDRIGETISELYSALMPGGVFMFTVPVKSFATHLSRHFGPDESERINTLWYHRNMNDAAWWRTLLEARGFQVRLLQPYQPEWFTVAYFTLSTRLFRLLLRLGLDRTTACRRLASRLVRRSISETGDGANIFVIAVKPG